MDIKETTLDVRQQNIINAYVRMQNFLDVSFNPIKSYGLKPDQKQVLEIVLSERWHTVLSVMNDHWSKIPAWSCEQATALSLQIDPKLIERIRDKRKRFSDFKGQILTLIPAYQDLFKEFFTPELLDEYLDRYQIFESQFKFNLHPSLKMIEWANHRGIFFLQELSEKVKKYSGDPTDWQKEYEKKCEEVGVLKESSEKVLQIQLEYIDKLLEVSRLQKVFIERQKNDIDNIIRTQLQQRAELEERLTFNIKENFQLKTELQKYQSKQIHPKEKESLLKLTITQAVGGYGYVQGDKKSPTIKAIYEDAIKCGISLDEDTIRKYIKQAKDFIPSSIIT